MSSVLDVLDRFPQDRGEDEERRWRDELERSLSTAPGVWVSAVGPPGSHGLAKERAWVLLSWVEDAASAVPSSRRRDLVETAAFVLSLLEASPLDRRDVMVVAMLVRRASTIAGLPFETLVERGCERAGTLGARCREWLLRITDATPSTHEEVGTGRDVVFRRRPSTIDAAALERSLSTGEPRSRGRTVPPSESGGGAVWPTWVRYPLIVVLVAFALIGVITALYDRGWLPLAGPFVATIVASTLVYLVVRWRNRRARRLSEDAVLQLRSLAAAIERERALTAEVRPTRASDDSLIRAADQVRLALQRLAWGHDQGATPFVRDLAATARDAWLPGAPLSDAVDRLARTSSELDELAHKLRAAAERGRRDPLRQR